MKKTIIVCSVFVSIVIALWLRDIVTDRRNELEILKPIAILETAPQNYPKENRNVGLIQAGEKVKVLRMGYGKDFRSWKIQGSLGQEGWLIEEKGNINVKN
jgi:hypothetical protein